MTARLYRSGINLHVLWKESCKDNKLLDEWSEGKADTNNFGVLVLRTLALLRNLEPKIKTLINLDPNDFAKDWRRAAKAFNSAIELMTNTSVDGFGVFAQKWLPGNGLIPVLAALRAVIEDNSFGSKERSDLRRWYWSSVFLERYSGSVESTARRDFAEFVDHWSNDGTPPSIFSEAQVRIGATGYSVRESASHASAVYSGIFCLLAIKGARDWKASESIELHKLDDHHIFPKGFLHKNGFDTGRDKKTINSIVNRTLISETTNRKIGAASPGGYLLDKEIFESDPAQLLDSHFVNEQAIKAMLNADDDQEPAMVRALFGEFRAAREESIIAAIRDACGISAVSVYANVDEFDDEPDYDDDEDDEAARSTYRGMSDNGDSAPKIVSTFLGWPSMLLPLGPDH